MSLREQLIQWNEGIRAFESRDYHRALSIFIEDDNAKMSFNVGLTQVKLGRYADAVVVPILSALISLHISL